MAFQLLNTINHTVKVKMNINHALLHSHSSYCAMIWISSISKKQLKQLKTVQKKALRIVFSKKYNAHTDGLFEKGRISKEENIFEKEAHKF